jgi:predicted transcriptional regulator of viral defense system
MQKNFLKRLLRSEQTVFSFKELLLTFRTDDSKSLKAKLNYYVKKGDLYRIRRGLYAKDVNYNRLELATKILIPSYISFETVLRSAGVIFQYYSQIFVASYQTKNIVCDGKTYSFRTIKPTILTNSLGIELREHYSIATPERAFLDVVYLNPEYHFDNFEPLDWNKVYEIVPIYENESMKHRVDRYKDAYDKSLSETSIKKRARPE